jgi:pimeloyl-ACP methyl ester carboxylesterase
VNADQKAAARERIAHVTHGAATLATHHEGACMRWRRIGTGPHLLLVHGGQGNWLHWVRNIEALAAKFTLWLPDLPGLGESDRVPEPITMQSLVAPLRHGLDTLVGPTTEVSVAAFSFGAVPAVGLIAERGHVKRFAMIGGTGHGLPRRTADLRKWKDLPDGPEQDEAHRYNLSQQMLHDTAAIDNVAVLVHGEALQRTRLRSRPLSRSTVMREALERVEIPILMLWGEHDVTALGEATAREMAQGHPNRQWQVVAGASHWLQYERPEFVNRVFIDWFSEP